MKRGYRKNGGKYNWKRWKNELEREYKFDRVIRCY